MRLVSVYDEPRSIAILYELLKGRSTEDDPHVNISHRKLPTLEEHTRFVQSVPYWLWYLIEVHQRYVGYVLLSKRNELGVAIFKKYRRQGHATAALKMLMERHDPLPAIPSERSGSWLANVHPRNEASIRMFEKLGFKLLQNTYARTHSRA